MDNYVARLTGEVCSGRNKANRELEECADDLYQITGRKLFPGSLNVLLKDPVLLSLETANFFDHDTRMLWPATINNLDCWIYRWRMAPLHVAEILSTDHLRETLSLQNEDEVTICTDSKNVMTTPVVGKVTWLLFWWGRRKRVYDNDNYSFRTLEWSSRFGATQKVTTESITSLMSELVKSFIKKTPFLGTIAVRIKRLWDDRGAVKNQPIETYAFSRIDPDPQSDQVSCNRQQILNLLNYTKTSGSAYSAYVFPAGYHTIEICGERVYGQRDPGTRLNDVPFDFKGSTVLDIGTNQGGMLFEVGPLLRWGIGIDFDYRMINAANKINSVRGGSQLAFYVLDLESDPLELILDFCPSEKIDIVFLLSVCMWISNWREVIRFCSTISERMLFESNGTEDQQQQQENFLRECFDEVRLLKGISEDDPGQKKRMLFFCTQPLTT